MHASCDAIQFRLKTLGRYELLRCIGHGAMGTVFEALDCALQRRVAVKLWRHPFDEADAHRGLARFVREGRVAARIRHPHIVGVHDVGVADGVPFLVMELVDGETLAGLLRRQRNLPVQRAVEIMFPILSAVAELHAAHIVHRDIKPSNILLAYGDACPKLADFGVARFDDGSPLTRSGAIIGTPQYMAPELLRGEARADERTDEYALGVTLYECVTGKRPFAGTTEYTIMHAAISEALEPPSVHVSLLPKAFDAVVLRAMQRDPRSRFGSIDAFAQALLPFAGPTAVARWRDEFVPMETSVDVAPITPDARAAGSGGIKRHRRMGAIALGAGTALALLGVVPLCASFARSRSPSTALRAAERVEPQLPSTAAPEETRLANPPESAPGVVVAVTVHPSPIRKAPGPHVPPASVMPPAVPVVRGALSQGALQPAVSVARGENSAPILDVP